MNFFSLGVTAEALRVIICSKSAISLQRGSVDAKFQVEGVAPTNRSFSQKTRINDLSYGIIAYIHIFLKFCQIHTFDRHPDGQTEFSSVDRVCIPYSVVKTTENGEGQLHGVMYDCGSHSSVSGVIGSRLSASNEPKMHIVGLKLPQAPKGWLKNTVSKFWTINCDNSKTVRDRMSVLITNRKLRTGFRLIPSSMTLSDLERRNSCYFAFFHRMR